jgi:signal transduction histidine kinase/ActR/RegA family two-component response regulator
VNAKLRSVPAKFSRHASRTFLRWLDHLPLRTKLLFSFILLTAGLTFATLFVVHHNAEAQTQQQIEQDAHNASAMFRVVQRQQQAALSRKADLLASLALMRNGDATAIEDAGADPWQSDDCNLFVLADRTGQIVALHSASSRFPSIAAQEMLLHSINRGETSGWWFGGKQLYQIVLQPFYEDTSRKDTVKGFVVVGRLIDDRAATDLSRIAAGDVVFRYGQDVAVSTLPALQQLKISDKARSEHTLTQVDLAGDRYYASSVDLTPGERPGANLIVLKSYKEVTAYLDRLNQLLLGIGLVTIIAGGAMIFVISDTVTRPLASLMLGVQALERGDYSFPLAAGGQDELSHVTRAFDRMRSTLKTEEEQRDKLEGQLRQAQKMEALGRLAGGVAHDFNNLLTVIGGHSELLLDRLQPGDPLFLSSQQIRKTADRAAALTRQMLAFSRMQVVQAQILDVNEISTEMGKLLRRLVREDIEFNLCLGESIGRVKADPSQIEQVLLNLAVNSSDAMPMGGKLTIQTQNIVVTPNYIFLRPSLEPGKYVLITVTDTGHGMNAETKARIFEPFFTTKEPGKGTGLGLATVYGVVKQSGGFIWVESAPGCGTRFEIYLPATDERPDNSQVELVGKAVAPNGQRKTVLVVEDEQEVRELAYEFLSGAGYNVLTAKDGLEALETVQRLGNSIDAVLTDVVMPNMRGPELGSRLKTLIPQVKIVYMTGYLEQTEAGSGFLDDAVFLQKPFSRDTILSQVAKALILSHAKKRKPAPQSIAV